MIGKKIEEAVKASGKTEVEVAAYAGMSLANLYKLYKKEDIKSIYLKKIAEILNKSVNYFLYDNVEDERASYSPQIKGGIGNAGRDIHDQKIMPGENSGKNIPVYDEATSNVLHQLELCKSEKASLEKEIALKDRIIELLESKQK